MSWLRTACVRVDVLLLIDPGKQKNNRRAPRRPVRSGLAGDAFRGKGSCLKMSALFPPPVVS